MCIVSVLTLLTTLHTMPNRAWGHSNSHIDLSFGVLSRFPNLRASQYFLFCLSSMYSTMANVSLSRKFGLENDNVEKCLEFGQNVSYEACIRVGVEIATLKGLRVEGWEHVSIRRFKNDMRVDEYQSSEQFYRTVSCVLMLNQGNVRYCG